MATPPDPDTRALPAIAGGAGLIVLMLAIGAFATGQGMPLLWLFVGPWAFVGVLLMLWGWQRRPRR